MPASEIGVSSTRWWPNSCSRPKVTVKAPPKPPGTPMSSPSRITRSSRRISSRNASRSASTIVNFLSFRCACWGTLFSVDIGQAILRQRAGAGFGKSDGLVQLPFHRFLHLFDLLRGQNPLRQAESLVAEQRIALFPFRHLL